MTQFAFGSSYGVDAYTKILLHMDGADGGTVFRDEANPARVWTASGTAVTTNTAQKFGPTSLRCGTVQGFITTPNDAAFLLGSGPFTVDCWFNILAGAGTVRRLGGQTQGGGFNCIVCDVMDTNVLRCAVNIGGTNQIAFGGATVAAGSGWHHYAAVRSGDTLAVYLDGAQQATLALPAGGSIIAGNEKWGVGEQGNLTDLGWNGWIDEFRLSVGIARWTANFTPPTAPY